MPQTVVTADPNWVESLTDFLPASLCNVTSTQTFFPRIAKSKELSDEIEDHVRRIPTTQSLLLGDARGLLSTVPDASVHLIVTSPPYWILKKYPIREGQLGHVDDYDEFVENLSQVWIESHRVLVDGGRLVVVVGDVSLKRRDPLWSPRNHAATCKHTGKLSQELGFDNLTPIIWHKTANASYESEGRGGFRKPYEPNAIIKNDIEFILQQRKPGLKGARVYRSPTNAQRVLSVIPEHRHHQWFQSIWNIHGESLKYHPAPFPLELAERLVRMFSFVGDTVLDPFCGTGTTLLAAGSWGRHGLGIDIEPQFLEGARFRLATTSAICKGDASQLDNFERQLCFGHHFA